MVIGATTGGLPDMSGAGIAEPVGAFLSAVIATGYLWTWIGIFKLVTGVLILIPRTSPLGIIAFPYMVNILLWVTFLATDFAILGVPAFLANCYLIYAYFDRYKPILA